MSSTTSSRPRPSVAVIGAGVSGLMCARTLVDSGYCVTVFDKGRRPGGRVATRRAGQFTFDHGAQYFTIATDALLSVFATLTQRGAIAPWDGSIVSITDGHAETIHGDRRRWVGIPGMSALPRHLSTNLDIRCGHTIADITRLGNAWRLVTQGGSVVSEADVVVVAVPSPQAVPLLATSRALADRAAAATMAPCWAVMLGFKKGLSLPFDGAFVGDGPLTWISLDRSKPGRDGGEAWVLHASPQWSRNHLEAEHQAVSEDLRNAFQLAIGKDVLNPAFAAAHRWRCANVEAPLGQACLFDADLRIGACGDWCLGGKIEASMASGRALADQIIDNRGTTPTSERVKSWR